MATRSMAIRIRAVIGVSFCRCTNFPTRPYEEPMKLSYFSYDFSACCCEAVNAVVCVGTFRSVSKVLLAVWHRWCSGRRVLCQAGLRRGRRPARSPALLCPARSPAAAWPARPLAVRAASFARRVDSLSGQAPQAPRRPPIGRCLSLVCCRLVSATAHGHHSQALRSLRRRPPPQWGLLC